MNIIPDGFLKVWIKRIILLLILAYALLSAIFYRAFAELHIRIFNFDFPVFISELLLLFSVLTIVTCHYRNIINWPRKHLLLLIASITFIIAKAVHGYISYGPLALRNAAIFYYAFFAIAGYYLYDREFLTQRAISYLVTIAVLAKFLFNLNAYYVLPLCLISLALSLKIKNNFGKIAFVLLSLYLPQFYEPSGLLVFCVRASRGRALGQISAVIFLFIVAIKPVLNKKQQIFAFAVILLISLIGVNIYMDKNSVKSLLDISGNIVRIKKHFQDIHEREISLGALELEQRFYKYRNEIPPPLPLKSSKPALYVKNIQSREDFQELMEGAFDTEYRIAPKKTKRYRDLDSAYGNSAFRIFIWIDMVDELIDNKALLGINFGKPQRSHSIEMLNWAASEWKRDGWITPHNSFLHMVYRAGILGIVFICCFFSLFFDLFIRLYAKRDFSGLIIIGIFVYWIIISNFNVFLEFPYNAIPFWALFGLTIRYSLENKEIKD
ncbi:MAG: O-antigen ligase family protein [Candidatus Omnitrophica bacterium]|nr:O-antigen ligase family protein [Candidatus Omnitrophota bacterium]